MKIRVENNPPVDKLDRLGVSSWPIWAKEVSRFPWRYDSTETCYLLEGEIIVTPTAASRCGPGKAIWSPFRLDCPAPGISASQ
jgi:hypothetical protein